MSSMFYFVPSGVEDQDSYIPLCLRYGIGNGNLSYIFNTIESDAGPIDTWERWKRLLSLTGQIWCEWGFFRSYADFISEIETCLVEHRRTAYDSDARIRYRLCPDGFTFTDRLE